MPIDDIQYLYKNNVKENIVLLVDSNKRDKKRWRTPAEFVVEFPEPFKNVYGVELLNASVARTMFTVDKHNNKLSVLTNNYVAKTHNNDFNEYKYTDMTLSITDYKDANKMMDELSNVLENASNQFDKTFSSITAVEAQDTSTDISTKQFLKFTSDKTPFIINRRLSSLNKTLGFSLLADEIDDDIYKVLKNCINTDIVSFSTVHVDSFEQITFTEIFSVNPSDMIRKETNPKIVKLPLKFMKKYNAGIFIKSMVHYSVNNTSNDISSKIIKKYTFDDVILQIPVNETFEIVDGDEIFIEYYYLIDNLKTLTSEDESELFISKTNVFDGQEETILTINTHYSVVSSDTSSISINKIGENTLITEDGGVFVKKFKIEINQLNTVHLFSSEATIIHVLFTESRNQNIVFRCKYYKDSDDKYYIEYQKPPESQYFNHIHIKLTEYTLSVLDGDTNENVTLPDNDIDEISPVKNFELFATKFSITPPGIINFATENYVTLHIKEIEEHVRGSYDANDVSPGIAMLNVDVQSGYADNATEFTRVEYKEFHPIGKLSKLHFRLQRKLTKELYDCKGVDVHYLLSIKMLNPSKLNNQKLEYTLNPNYDPDYQGFMKTEFDNVESDEEIESRSIRDEHYDRERELQNLKNNIDRNFVDRFENHDLESVSDESDYSSESGSEYETE